jgi:hypothetical protein
MPLALLLPKFLLYFSPVIRGSTGSREFLIDLPFAASAAIRFSPSSRGLFKLVYADTTEELLLPGGALLSLPATLIVSENASFEFVAFAVSLGDDWRIALLSSRLSEFLQTLTAFEKGWTRAHDEALLQFEDDFHADRTLSFTAINHSMLLSVDRRILGIRLDLIPELSALPLDFIFRMLERFRLTSQEQMQLRPLVNRSRCARDRRPTRPVDITSQSQRNRGAAPEGELLGR